MRCVHGTWLAVLLACSNHNPRPPQPDRSHGDTAQPAAATPVDAARAAGAPPVDAGLTQSEIDDALHGLYSEHGRQDVRPLAWWKEHADVMRPHLRALLEDGKDNGTADRWAIQILGDLGDAADVELLASVLATWKADTARERAAAALGVHPAPAASAALIAATRDMNIDTASYATSGLGSRKADGAARARLEELLNHPDSTIRFRAVNALAEMGGSKAALAKRKGIEKSAEVKSAIVNALKSP